MDALRGLRSTSKPLVARYGCAEPLEEFRATSRLVAETQRMLEAMQ